ncbi:hypothetical protein PMY56_13645 [Clostridium tertium]|uniref:hypothetical protein n=1 Tax=Clostridium tertium TaxID=1559 RepID=UPI00232AE5C1|nr:hypothetical protein [Clostridium tertium]MDB1924058.1 hypothetical protein [Clostridium tertium]MDB1927181.1 hypothetical protein [Clostridium tertium]MDB1930958.1 hypothetical protein [Clostridium tertium]
MKLPLTDFWSMTPYEFFILVESYIETEEERSKELIVQAYYAEAFARMKKLPKLEKILNTTKPKKKQSDEDMLRVVEELNRRLGGEIIGSST